MLSLVVTGSVRPALAFEEPATPTEVIEAEEAIRLAAEEAASRIQRSVSANVNTVMERRPATSFNLRNAVRAGQNAVNAASRAARARFAQVVAEVIDDLDAGDTPIIDIIRLSEQYDSEINDNLRELTDEGVRDLASLVRNGRRTDSVRGTFVGRYELFVSQLENGREEVKIGEVTLGESQMIRGPIETEAAIEFFLDGMDVPTPRVVDLPSYTVLKAVRWLYRAGPMIVSNDDARVSTLAPLNAQEFSITGIDLLPERLRFELELLLEDTVDVTTNPEGVNGYFRSFTYTFRRIVEAE
jgi:hypothetical protein